MDNTLLEGALPKHLFHTCGGNAIFGASGLSHKGTIPVSVSRLHGRNQALVFGHGFIGLFPRVPGTLHILSVFQNKLEGHLCELQIKNESELFVYANDFSCQLPRNGEVTPFISFALVGNHFAMPRHQLPAWIT
eukprot:2996175-Amphidinium_carterae.1